MLFDQKFLEHLLKLSKELESCDDTAEDYINHLFAGGQNIVSIDRGKKNTKYVRPDGSIATFDHEEDDTQTSDVFSNDTIKFKASDNVTCVIRKNDDDNENSSNETSTLKKIGFNNPTDLYKTLDTSLKDTLEEAQSFYDNEAYHEAFDIYRVLALTIPCEYIYLQCARSCFYLGDFDLTLYYSDLTLKLNNDNIEATQIGQAAILTGQYLELMDKLFINKSAIHLSKIPKISSFLDQQIDLIKDLDNN